MLKSQSASFKSRVSWSISFACTTILLFISTIISSTMLSAAPAVFTKGELLIPQGAVISGNSRAYYSDITLAMDEEGGLVITGASKNSLVTVEEVDVLVMESLPLQVSLSISGFLSVPCVELLSPAVSFADNQFSSFEV